VNEVLRTAIMVLGLQWVCLAGTNAAAAELSIEQVSAAPRCARRRRRRQLT
jgi:hypothetical protein